MLRSKLGGHYAGIGTHQAFLEDDAMYKDHKESNVRLPSDHLKGAKLATMSGPVTTYSMVNVVQLLPDCEVCGRRMDTRFLKNWNAKRACTPCISELTAEVPDVEYSR